MILVTATQLLAAISLLNQVYEKGMNWYTVAPDAQTLIFKFMCGFVLHIYLSSEILQGFSNIKFLVNHPWKFERKLLAFLSGVFQVTVIGLIEFTNYILVMTSNSYKEIVLNFILLVIISQFDDFFYKTFADIEKFMV